MEILKKTNDYVSGEDMAAAIGVSRTTIWKCINDLREDGYKIVSVTKKGYKLCEIPDILDKNDILKFLGTYRPEFVGTDICVLKTVLSTNEEIKRLAHEGAESGTLVAADVQTAGKGRMGRVWTSCGGGLYFSFLLRPDLAPSDVAAVTLAAGYSVCLTVRRLTGCDAKIKWPNDVIIGNKKICGILTEMEAQTDLVDFVVIGIGVNINQESFAEDVRDKASSLFLKTGQKLDRNKFLAEIIKSLDKTMQSYLLSVSVDDMKMFKDLCATLGRRVRIERSRGYIEGIAVDILPTGELVIKTDDKKNISVCSGEVVVQGIY